MSLLDRIANYFKEWDGIDETAPKMELSIHDLRYIADMNVERCRLIRQLNEANLKTEKIRAKAIDEFAERLKNQFENWSDTNYILGQRGDDEAWGKSKAYDSAVTLVDEIAEEMKGGAE